MTEAEIEAIRERAAKATPGEWRVGIVEGEGPLNRVQSPEMLIAVCENGETLNYSAFDARWEPHFANANFIAHARTDIPALLAELDALREENRKLQNTILELHSVSP